MYYTMSLIIQVKTCCKKVTESPSIFRSVGVLPICSCLPLSFSIYIFCPSCSSASNINRTLWCQWNNTIYFADNLTFLLRAKYPFLQILKTSSAKLRLFCIYQTFTKMLKRTFLTFPFYIFFDGEKLNN